MTAIANLLDPRSAELLAAVRARAEQRERRALEAAASTPGRPTCPPPAALFRSAPR